MSASAQSEVALQALHGTVEHVKNSVAQKYDAVVRGCPIELVYMRCYSFEVTSSACQTSHMIKISQDCSPWDQRRSRRMG